MFLRFFRGLVSCTPITRRGRRRRRAAVKKSEIDIWHASFPEEIIIEILARLPVKSLLQCKCLCKYLLKLITSPYFVQLQLDRANENNSRIILATVSNKHYSLSSLDYYNQTSSSMANRYKLSLPCELLIVGSCNGLVCLSDYKTIVVICNPATLDYISVPFDLIKKRPAYCNQWFGIGFGHDPHSDKYKVVRVDMYFSSANTGDPGDCDLHVYTLGTKQWRRIEIPCHLAQSFSIPYLNGALHWLRLTDQSRWDHNPQITDDKSIMAFDIRSEKFEEVPKFSSHRQTNERLGVLQGCLSCTKYYGEYADIWLMKQYGVKESWTKLLSICFPSRRSCQIKPLVVRRKGEILLEPMRKSGYVLGRAPRSHLYEYEPISNSLNEYDTGNIRWIDVHAYVESLVTVTSCSCEKTEDEGKYKNGAT
ncbi:hypothetical protein IFM89_013900 [Coptis chinensis]|uniref:F-box domain-containing protein n=1 Tax=Coptis chinensis TaxID=261450 RepID=A0A835HEL0_9MAGN|nr:hypothetical protein IFM89_013900 [Coptis chinensis]